MISETVYTVVGMDPLQEKRFLEALERLSGRIRMKRLKKMEKVWERVGIIRERYPSIAQYYTVTTETTQDGKETQSLRWEVRKVEREQREKRTGCYVLESTRTDLSAEEIWKLYMTIQPVESAFRCLKSELGLRPIYHQKKGCWMNWICVLVLLIRAKLCGIAHPLLDSAQAEGHPMGSFFLLTEIPRFPWGIDRFGDPSFRSLFFLDYSVHLQITGIRVTSFFLAEDVQDMEDIVPNKRELEFAEICAHVKNKRMLFTAIGP